MNHRLAEVLGSLSLATDSANGVAPETALRVAWIAAALARAVDADVDERRDAYYAGVLRFLGCTSFAAETARWAAGDDRGLLRGMMTVDTSSTVDRAKHAWRAQPDGAALGAKTTSFARMALASDARERLVRAHCDQADQLARQLAMPEGVRTAVGAMFERWDGRGAPLGLRGDEVTRVARIVQVAFRVETHRAALGFEASREAVRERRGNELDPEIADAFAAIADEMAPILTAPSVWDAFLAAEPAPWHRIDPESLGDIAAAFADYTDLKSPYTLGHSPRVAVHAANAARALGLDAAVIERVRLAGLLHDLGRVAVPNGIWDKKGPLHAIERDQVEEHARHTARILARSPLLAPLASIAAAAHERADSSGYPRAVGADALPIEAHLIAAADVFCALGEPRPHRPALTNHARAAVLNDELIAGRLARSAVEALLAIDGAPAARAWPDRLSDREIEVLTALARGAANKEIAVALGISPKTVQHHVSHIYAKTGARTRAALALYAVRHRLLAPPRE